MLNTIVNAGFNRPIAGTKPKRFEWKNVTGIAVALPPESLGSIEFRDAIRAHAPAGPGWTLQGYAVVSPK